MNVDFRTRLNALGAAVGGATWTDAQGSRCDPEDAAQTAVQWFADLRARRARLYIIGNGGSAAIAGHAATDFVNMAEVSAMTLHDSPVLTCMSNDYGYENAYARMLALHVTTGDALVAISSSGKSANIRNAVAAFRAAGGGMALTLTGFGVDNPLRTLGDLNVWLDSSNYGIVEIGHQFILHNLSDRMAAASS